MYKRFGLSHAAQFNFGNCFAAVLAERELLHLADADQDQHVGVVGVAEVQPALEAGGAQLLRRRSRLTKR